eukprot:363864-Chlamydomonas_euryale.AAC.11
MSGVQRQKCERTARYDTGLSFTYPPSSPAYASERMHSRSITARHDTLAGARTSEAQSLAILPP